MIHHNQTIETTQYHHLQTYFQILQILQNKLPILLPRIVLGGKKSSLNPRKKENNYQTKGYVVKHLLRSSSWELFI